MRNSSSPSQPQGGSGFSAPEAFTLIELLTVIAVIAILATITLKIGQGVQQRSAIGKAKVELAILANALEQYKLQYGDYPWVEETSEDYYKSTWKNQETLFQAVTGTAGVFGPKDSPHISILPTPGRQFVELSKFVLKDSQNSNPLANWFLDPWGKPYSYYYKVKGSPGTWTNPSFVLYSHGPDSHCASEDPSEAGIPNTIDPASLDNIYAGRE